MSPLILRMPNRNLTSTAWQLRESTVFVIGMQAKVASVCTGCNGLRPAEDVAQVLLSRFAANGAPEQRSISPEDLVIYLRIKWIGSRGGTLFSG
jgi:hypothetical protein